MQVWYIPLLTLAMALMMLRPLLMARLLDAHEFAVYSAGLLVSSTFCMLGCLGLQPMLQRKMPMDLIAGRELASLVLLVQCIAVAFLCALVVSGVGFSGISVAGLTSKGFTVSLLHGLFQQLFLLATIESRSRGEPLRFSHQNLVRAALVVSGAGIMAWYTRSSTATLLVEAVLSLLITWRIVRRVILRKHIRLDVLMGLAARRMTKISWRDAIALMGVMLVGFALTNIDRWLAASLLEPRFFAYYAFAWVLLTASQSIQTIVNSSVYPSLARRYAAHGRWSSFQLAAKASVLFLFSSLVLAWPAYQVLQYLIAEWFSDYAASIQLIPVFIAVAVLRLSDFWSSHLIIVGRERLLLIINITVGVVVFLFWIAVVNLTMEDVISLHSLALLALALTISNYFAVLCTAIRVRR